MVRIFVASRRPCASEALATSSYVIALANPFFDWTVAMADVSVVLPWSTWPIVPTLTCGLVHSKISLAILVPFLHSRCEFPLVGYPPTRDASKTIPRSSDRTLSPLCYLRINCVARTNVRSFACGAASLACRRPTRSASGHRLGNNELLTGFEPVTSSLPRTRSTN